MVSIGNMKVGARLGLGFGLVGALLVLVAFVGVGRLGDLNRSMKLTVGEDYPKTATANDIAFRAMDNARIVRNVILIDGPAKLANRQAYDKNLTVINKEFESLGKSVNSAKGKELFKAMRDARAVYESYTDNVLNLALFNQGAEATKELYGENYKTQAAYIAAVENFVKFQEAKMREGGKHGQEVYSVGFALILIIAGVAIALAAAVALWVTRSITRPLAQAVGVAEKVAAGDLTSVIEVKSKDETGRLLQALKVMNASLLSIVTEVRGGTEAINSGAKQIASGNADLSARTEEQASSLEETASSMEELTGTVKHNAENARQANQLAQGASAVALKGGKVVGEVVETMSAINDSSKRIADIIGVIDGIAFQTNILALNAAVEAARAGEQGRGFAVVASEVRSLAQRSAAAAKEIKQLIGDSVVKVGAGSKLVDEAGKTMQEIVTSVKRVTDIMAEITVASQEQSRGIEQVNQTLAQMDEVTQQNASLVEEAAAASESLQEQAQNLERAVAVFKLEEGLVEPGFEADAQAAQEPQEPQPAKPFVERRGPNRATNVARLPERGRSRAAQPAAPADKASANGGDKEWAEF